MASHAEWATGADDLANDLVFAAQQYTLGQVSDMTGLSDKTILDSLTREAITNPVNARGALCRPRYRIGTTPLWAPEQVDDYHERKARADALTDEDLPLVDVDEANERGLVTNRQIVERLGIHDQTVRKHQRNDAKYPPPVGKLSRGGSPGVPERLREWTAILAWVETKPGIQVPKEWAA